MKNTDLTSLFKNFKGTWVATETDGGPVICTGDTAAFVKKKAFYMGYKNPILTCLVDDAREATNKPIN